MFRVIGSSGGSSSLDSTGYGMNRKSGNDLTSMSQISLSSRFDSSGAVEQFAKPSVRIRKKKSMLRPLARAYHVTGRIQSMAEQLGDPLLGSNTIMKIQMNSTYLEGDY